MSNTVFATPSRIRSVSSRRWPRSSILVKMLRRLQMAQEAKVLRKAPLATPTDLKPNAVRDLAGALNILLADMFGLYLKTKNFHWHVSGPHFRDYHLLLDEQGEAHRSPDSQNRADRRRTASSAYVLGTTFELRAQHACSDGRRCDDLKPGAGMR